jgi:Leucine-rich repeat (LRR) protein
LKKLSLESTKLKALPASVGRLGKLEVLSLAKNDLYTLPITLGFCENLRVLNLQGNKFQNIPAVILELTALKELKRLDNPLTERYHMQAPRYTSEHRRDSYVSSSSKNNTVKVFNPKSLQTLCTKSVFTSKLDYWKQSCLGPLQCKILDKLAVEMDVCNNCGTVVFKKGEYKCLQ